MGGQPETPSVTTTTSPNYTPNQQRLADIIGRLGIRAAGQPIGQPIMPQLAGFNANELAAQDMMVNAAGTAQTTADNTVRTHNFLLDPALLSPDTNPYSRAYGDVIADTMNNKFTQQVLPNMRANNVANSGMGSSNTRNTMAEMLASGENSRAVGGALTDFYNRAYTTNLGTLQNAVSQAGGVQRVGQTPANMLAAVGGQQRAMTQAELDLQTATEQARRDRLLNRAIQLQALLNGQPIATQSVGTPAVPQTDPLQQAMGGFGALLGMFL